MDRIYFYRNNCCHMEGNCTICIRSVPARSNKYGSYLQIHRFWRNMDIHCVILGLVGSCYIFIRCLCISSGKWWPNLVFYRLWCNMDRNYNYKWCKLQYTKLVSYRNERYRWNSDRNH